MRTSQRQRVAAYALVSDGAGRVLLVRQPDGWRHTGRWSLPGGGVEPGEHPEQAVIREVREETGLPVHVGALREVISDVTRVGRRRRPLHNVRLVYQATVTADGPEKPRQLPADARWCAELDLHSLPLDPFAARLLGSEPG